MKKITLFLIVFAIASLFIACTKEGPAGTNGTNGTNGIDGNANVHSNNFTISSWTFTSPSYHADIIDNDITQSVIDNGLVMVYMQIGTSWRALPFTRFPSNTVTTSWTFEFFVNGLTLYKTDSDNSPTDPGTVVFKVVTADGIAGKKMPNIDWSNYTIVQHAFNLSE